MSIPILTKKPKINLPPEVLVAVSKMDIVSTLIVMGVLLNHALNLCGLQPEVKSDIS